jgi:hypothetical protein
MRNGPELCSAAGLFSPSPLKSGEAVEGKRRFGVISEPKRPAARAEAGQQKGVRRNEVQVLREVLRFNEQGWVHAEGEVRVEVARASSQSMTETERKQRSEKSAIIVVRLVRVQLRAMGCERFDLGIRREGGEMILREGQGTAAIEQAVKWLRHENAKGAHIYIRPTGPHGLSLIDDLTAEAIERMKAQGFAPAVVVETSPNNFQAWVNHGRVLEPAGSTQAAKQLAERFGGDPSSADWRHFGRLAGFTNSKPERRLPSGARPFVRLRSASGRVYSKTVEFLAGIQPPTTANQTGQKTELRKPRDRRRPAHLAIRPLAEFHVDPAYGGDLHRSDMAWARHAAASGLTFEQIKDELLNGRDLGKKGSRQRQLEYAARTAEKALRSL